VKLLLVPEIHWDTQTPSPRHWYATIGVSCDIWQNFGKRSLLRSTKSCNVRLLRRIACIYNVQKNSMLRARSDVLSRYLQKSSRSSAYSHKKNSAFLQHRQKSHEVLSARLMSKETPQVLRASARNSILIWIEDFNRDYFSIFCLII